jgi:hypothetical protein
VELPQWNCPSGTAAVELNNVHTYEVEHFAEQGYGHARKGVQLDIATKHAGVSINDLTDELMIDELTGNAVFSNVAVRVEKLNLN